MEIRVFTIRALDADETSVAPLNTFLRSHRIVTIDREFVNDGPNSYWSLCVTYVNEAPSQTAPSANAKKRIDYREVLSESDFAVFANLRTLRKRLADQEGVPAYALFTNEQLAEMVRRKVDSKTALGKINGIGEARVEKYGEAFLTAIKQGAPQTDNSNQGDAKTQSSQH